MQLHEVTAKLRPELEMRHPDLDVLFGAIFNTPTEHRDSGEAYVRIGGKPFHVEYDIQFGAVKLNCNPISTGQGPDMEAA